MLIKAGNALLSETKCGIILVMRIARIYLDIA